MRKLLTMHKVVYPRNDIDRLYVRRNEGEREITSTEDCVDEAI